MAAILTVLLAICLSNH